MLPNHRDLMLVIASDKSLGDQSRRVLMVLAYHAVGKWEVWPSNATIARMANMHVRKVQQSLSDLRKLGWIEGGLGRSRNQNPILIHPDRVTGTRPNRSPSLPPTCPNRSCSDGQHDRLGHDRFGHLEAPTRPNRSPQHDRFGHINMTDSVASTCPIRSPEERREERREEGIENAAAAACAREAGPVSIPMSDMERIEPDTLGGDEPLSPPPIRPVTGRDPEDAAMVTEAIALLHGNLNLEPFGRLIAEMAAKRPELEGWRFLYAARRATATSKPVRWPWVAKIVESAPRSEFESTITAQPKLSARAAANARALLL